MLSGKLVRLRPIELTDRDRYFEWINDPEVAEFLAARWLYSVAQEQSYVENATLQTRPPDLKLAIDTIEEPRHIGSINLHAFDYEDRRATLGIMIGDKSCWSRGLGTDAILTILRYGFEELNLNRVDLTCDERNGRGIAVTANAASSRRDACGNTGSRRAATGTPWLWRPSRRRSSLRTGGPNERHLL